MIKSKLSKVVAVLPPLNESGRKFYADDERVLQVFDTIGSQPLDVNSLSINEDGTINHFSVMDPATDEHLTTIFDDRFDGDVVVKWVF